MKLWTYLSQPKTRRVLGWILHVLLVIIAILILGYVNYHYRVGDSLFSPFPWLHRFWLPLLFIALYSAGWFGLWFLRSLTEPDDDEFPEIATAWNDILKALENANIDIRTVPLYVVLGRPATGAVNFFAASKLPIAASVTQGPVELYASREAIFIVASDASVLSALVTQQNATKITAPTTVPTITHTDTHQPVTVPGHVQASSVNPMANWMLEPFSQGQAKLPSTEVERQTARLTSLATRIKTQRSPYCPTNGLIWLFPVEASTNEESANSSATACRADLAALEDVFELDVPMVAVIADAHEIRGFRELVAKLPAGLIHDRLLGRSFPLVPNIPPESRYQIVNSGIDWVARELAPALLYQRFGDAPDAESATRLSRFVLEMYDRRTAISRLVAEGLLSRSERPPMLTGIYLAGTGNAGEDHAFAAGIIREMQATQNLLQWTDDAREMDSFYHRLATFGYFVMAAVLIALFIFIWSNWNR